MTINILAILLSMAMMLTGATGMEAPLAEPVSRTVTLSDLTISVGDEEVTLSPSASFGVTTDGAQAAYDFHIDLNGDRMLPFQAAADENGLLLVSESSGTTVKVSAEELEALAAQLSEQATVDNPELMAFITGEFMPAYIDLIKLVGDREAVKALQADGMKVYDEVVERGEGTPEQIEYDGATYDVTTYSYVMDSAAMGRLVDAIYASNEVMDNYAKAYFKLLAMIAENDDSEEASQLEGIDSFEKVMALADMRMNITESISEADALNITDGVLQMSIPEVDDPLEMAFRTEKLGDKSFSVVNGTFEIEEGKLEMYVEGEQDDDEVRGVITLSGSGFESEAGIIGGVVAPTEAYDEAEAEAQDEDADAAIESAIEDLGDAVEGEVEVIAMEDVAAEGEAETADTDDFYTSMDFYSGPDGDDTNYSVSWSVDVKNTASVNFDLEGVKHADGTSESRVDVYAYGVDATYEVAFNIAVDDAPFAVNADAENAVSLSEVNTEALMAGIGGDVMKLYADPSVQQIMGLFSAPDGEMSVDEAYEVYDEDGGDYDEDDADARSAEPFDDGELEFGTPEFTWLPEGYELTATDIDTQYDMVEAEFTNAGNGNMIYIYISTSNASGDVRSYTVDEDGAIDPIAHPVLVEEIDDDFHRYSVDDGIVSLNIFPYGDDVDAAAAAQLVAGIRYSLPEADAAEAPVEAEAEAATDTAA